MPNYKICRFCPNKYVPVSDEQICPDCEKAVVRAVSMPTGEPIVIADMSDETAQEIKDALEEAIDLPPDVLIKAGLVKDNWVAPQEPEIEIPLPPETVPIKEIKIEIVEASPKDLQKEKDLEVLEEAIVELKKGENAEIIAPSGPKPEEKPDAPS